MRHTVTIPTPALKRGAATIGGFHPSSGEARGTPTRLHRVDDVVYLDVASATGNRATVRYTATEPAGFTGVSRPIGVKHAVLAELIDKAPDEHIMLAWDDPKEAAGGLTLTSGKFTATLFENDAESVVTLEEARVWGAETDALARATMPAAHVAALFDVAAFTSTTPGGGGMLGVRIVRDAHDEAELSAVATNGFVLARVAAPLTQPEAWPAATDGVTISRHAAATMRARANALDEKASVTIWRTPAHLAFTSDEWHIEIRTFDPAATFPDWAPIVRNARTSASTVDANLDAQGVTAALKRVASVIDREAPGVRLDLTEFVTGRSLVPGVRLSAAHAAKGAVNAEDYVAATDPHVTEFGESVAKDVTLNAAHLGAAAERLFKSGNVRARVRTSGPLHLSADLGPGSMSGPPARAEFVIAPMKE